MSIYRYFSTVFALFIGLTYLAQPVSIVLSAPKNSQPPQTPAQIQTQMAKFVVRFDGNGKGNNGTGFIIKKDGLTYTVLTNEHVVRTSIDQKITTSDNRQYSFDPKSIKILSGIDLAEITFSSPTNYDVARLSKRIDIQLTKPVYAYGYPAINKPIYPTRQAKLLSGVINKALPTDNNDNGYVIVFDLPAIRGISGSPVCDENGEVIGIYGLTYKGNENLTLGIPISTYQQYASIDRAKLPAPSPKPKINKRTTRTISQPDRSTNVNFNLAYSFNGIDLLPVSPDSQPFETMAKNSDENMERLSGSSSAVAISPNGQTFVTGDSEGNLEIRQLQDGQVYQNLNSDKIHRSIRSIAISPDGETLVSVSGVSNIAITRLQDGKTLHYLYDHRRVVTSIVISPNGETFISGSHDKTIKVWRLRDGQLLSTFSNGHQDLAGHLVMSPDGRTFITGGNDNTIKVWRLEDGQLLNNLILEGNRKNSPSFSVNALAISPDGQTLVSASKVIKVWGLKDGKLLQTLDNAEDIREIVISPDGQTVFSGSIDKTIKVWQLRDGKLLGILRGHQSPITSLAISPDGRTLVSGSSDRNIKVWKVSP